MSIVVKHTSRDINSSLNFAATENTLAWAYTAEGDGEIYNVVKTNVASFTINGNVPVLPFTVSAGSSYSIGIVKQVNGQQASITLVSRRAINKTITKNVPDLALAGSGYLYSLLDNNTVIKRDPLLLVTSNYLGNGAWNVNPIVSTIALPTNGGIISWKYIHYDQGDVICWGRTLATGNSKQFICRIKPNDSVYDYFGNTLNGYYESASAIYNSINNHYPASIGNDYINGYFAISPFSSSGTNLGTLVKKSDLSSVAYLTSSGGNRQTYFNPIRSVFPLIGDLTSPENRFVNILYTNNLSYYSAFSINRNRTIKAVSNTYSQISEYNEFGNTIAVYTCSGTGEAGNGTPGNIVNNKRLDLCLSLSTGQSSFACCNFLGTIQFSRRITTFAESVLGSRYIAVNERSSQFFVMLGHASHLNKILIIDPLDVNIEVGYIQEASGVLCVCTNNYY